MRISIPRRSILACLDQGDTAVTPGCPEAYALAVSGVGDSELAQRVRSAVATIAASRANDFATDFKRTLSARRQGGWLHRHPPTSPMGTTWEPCLGCGAPSAIKIVKRCGCCTSRDECRCPPQWCEECMLKWWLSSNQKRVERSTPAPGVGMVAMGIDPRWTARCPTCRASFCLNDVIPVEVRVQRQTVLCSCSADLAVRCWIVGNSRWTSEWHQS